MAAPATLDWSLEEIEARRHNLMPDIPTIAGIAPIDPESITMAALLAAPALGTREAMIAAAYALVGLREQPMGSNKAPPVTTWYGLIGSWCDMSISYEGEQSDNLAHLGGKFCYCPAHTRWFLAHGLWEYGAGDLQPGDVVFYNWSKGATLDADHVGLVVHVYSDGTFLAAEGNHNDGFYLVHRDHTYVAGRGRPKYGNAPVPTPVPVPKKIDNSCWMG
jgi:hypothetical protein